MKSLLFLLLLLAQGPGPAVTGAIANGGGSGTTNHARQFNGTSDYLQSASALSALSGVNPFSVSFDLYWNAFANDDELALESSSSWSVTPGAFVVDPNSNVSPASGNFMWSETSGTSNEYFLCWIARPSAAAWHHYVLTMNTIGSTPVCTAYVDGISQGVFTGNVGLPPSAALSSQIFNVMSRNGSSLFAAGRISSPAIYSGVVDSTDASALGGCGRPTSVTSATLLYYWPINQTSPEVATTGSINLTVNGTTNVASSCSF
jgi:hypothetical protein